jgi:hypothetical protein
MPPARIPYARTMRVAFGGPRGARYGAGASGRGAGMGTPQPILANCIRQYMVLRSIGATPRRAPILTGVGCASKLYGGARSYATQQLWPGRRVSSIESMKYRPPSAVGFEPVLPRDLPFRWTFVP